MESNGNSKSGLITAGGILSIIGGALAVFVGGTIVVLTVANIEVFSRVPPLVYEGMIRGTILGASFFAVGTVAIIGGVSAVRRKMFGLSLAGAICCVLPSLVGFGGSLIQYIWVLGCLILGILAIIFVALGKREFGAKVKEDGI